MPSMNHSGSAAGVLPEDVVLERVHQFVAQHVVGFAEAGRQGQHDPSASPSVTPPVASEISPSMTLVCSNSGWLAYSTTGCREESSCDSSVDSRAYQRSAICAVMRAASASTG